MRNYLQHGRRHGPDGSDPIPGLGSGGSLPVAYIYSNPSGITVAADNGQHYISLQDGINFASFATTDSTVFLNGNTTLFTGLAVYGIQIQQAGTYEVSTNSFTQSGVTSSHTVRSYWAASNGSAPSLFQQGRSQANTLDVWDVGQDGVGPHLFTRELMTVTSGQTPATLVWWATISGGSNAPIAFEMVVTRLSTEVLGNV